MHIEIHNCFSFWGFAPGPHWVTYVPRLRTQDVPPHFVPGLRPWRVGSIWREPMRTYAISVDIGSGDFDEFGEIRHNNYVVVVAAVDL